MSRRILLALVLVALVAMPASAAVQNVKVSGSIDSTWLVRDQFGLGVDGNEFYQNLLITQVLLRVDADLTDNVSAVIELINEREWGDESNTEGGQSDEVNSGVDINQAYLTMREMLYSPLTVMVGRQPLRYGNALVIGDSDTDRIAKGRLAVVANDLSKRKTFDAVRAVLDYDPLTIDIVAAKIDANQVTGSSQATSSEDDVDLFGAQSAWQLGDDHGTVFEGYFWAKIDADNLESANHPGEKADKVYVLGNRIESNPIEGLYTSAEVAWQFGNMQNLVIDGTATDQPDNFKREAMAAQVIASYAIPGDTVAKYSPIVSGSYTYLSGDSDPEGEWSPDKTFNGWDPMFEDQGGGTIYNTLFSYTNAHIYNVALQMVPLEDLTAKFSWWGLWLDKEFDAANTNFITTTPDGAAVTYTVATDEKHLGNEFDLDLTYDYTEDVQIGFSAGWFFPGDVFTDANDDVAKQFLTNVNVNF